MRSWHARPQANLAAFITLSATPGLSATSVDAAMSSGIPLCMEEGGYNARITANYPRMAYELVTEANSVGDRLLVGAGCEGVLAPKNFCARACLDPYSIPRPLGRDLSHEPPIDAHMKIPDLLSALADDGWRALDAKYCTLEIAETICAFCKSLNPQQPSAGP